jgi:hypothetical protein
MAYGYSDSLTGAQPQVQIKRVGGWKFMVGLMLAAAGLGFAGYLYAVPYKKLNRTLHERASETSEVRGELEKATAAKDKLSAELGRRDEADRAKAAEAGKKSEAVEALMTELKAALGAVGATITTEENHALVSFPATAIFDAANSTVISGQGDTALKILAAAAKKGELRLRVKAKLIPHAGPRDIAQFKNIGEFTMLRAARVALALAADGAPAPHVGIGGEKAPPLPGRRAKATIPDRLDIEIEPV